MKSYHIDIFKELIKSYKEDNFEETVNILLSNNDLNKDKICSIISSLCGVHLKYSDNFVCELKKAIEKYNISHKVVEKVGICNADCIDSSGKTLCQKSCPFDAIYFDNDKETTYINNLKCTDCGFCVEACPNGAILDKVEYIPLLNILKSGTPIIAAVAPAITGQFGEKTTLNQLRAAFVKLGFTDMIEVAFFADMLSLKEAVEFNELVKDKNDLMITSCCCPMWVGMLKRVYEDLVKYVSPSVSPMIAAGRIIKKLNPACKVVFIGPCIAKKAEAKEKDLLGAIDYVLTFVELKEIFDAVNIIPKQCQELPSEEYASRGGRLYGRTGGVSVAISDIIQQLFPRKYKLLKAIQANGVKECKELLEKAKG